VTPLELQRPPHHLRIASWQLISFTFRQQNRFRIKIKRLQIAIRNIFPPAAFSCKIPISMIRENWRVKKTWTPNGGSAVTTYFVYDALGRLAVEVSDESGSTGTTYPFADMLGSVRAITNSAGGVTECYDYLPFGRMLSSSDNGRSNAGCYPGDPDNGYSSSTPQKFTGKERDAETGLDYFGARYLSSAQGRFTSPDSTAFASLRYPQAWNLYAYVRNNPLKFIDPSGHSLECGLGDPKQCLSEVQDSAANKEAASRLKPKIITEKGGFLGLKTITKTRIVIEGDIKSFRELGQNASRLADFIEDKKRVFKYNISTYWVGEANNVGTLLLLPGRRPLYGGGQSCLPSAGLEPEVFIDPNSAEKIDTDATDYGIPAASQGEKAAHELLGHLWGDVFGGHRDGTPENIKDALDAENAVRATDPKRGKKTHHH
jgi:RHS repeat-associated protein